jgi:hypothetical protein
MTNEPEDDEIPLLVQIVQANYDSFVANSRQLTESFRRDAARFQAERDLIREEITFLLNGKYAPSEWSIRKALDPNRDLVESRMRFLLKEPD